MPNLEQTVVSWFDETGDLARLLPSYRIRASQREMAATVARVIENKDNLIVEAGTGTGKTFAYMIPAMLSGKKVVVSTASKTLQDQLFQKDLPFLQKLLGYPTTAALLKGRSNYICWMRLEQAEQQGWLNSMDEVRQLKMISQFAKTNQTGDKAQCADVHEEAPVWSQITSTKETCLGQDCGEYERCFLMEARKKAREVDVVVVNHALFFADLALREEGVSQLLPQAEVVILDEAHQIAGVAEQYFGFAVSTRQFVMWAQDASRLGVQQGESTKAFIATANQVGVAARVVNEAGTLPQGRFEAARWLDDASATNDSPSATRHALNQLIEAAQELQQVLHQARDSHNEIALMADRGAMLINDLKRWLNLNQTGDQKSEQASESGSDVGLVSSTEEHKESDDKKIDQTMVRWVESTGRETRWAATPLNVSSMLAPYFKDSERAWVMTSATLAVKDDFASFINRVGAFEAQTLQLESPFDYPNQALLYHPQGIVDPNDAGFLPELLKYTVPLIEAAQGHSLILCTTLRAVAWMAEHLRAELTSRGLNYPVLAQGESGRGVLLKQFKETKHAVLIGSQSFWEGVDVPGDQLRLVVIDRLPFATPDDPVMAARIEHLKNQGLSPFFHFQVPQAVINLKQGAGRLIRTEKDRGVLMIADARLLTKPYGKLFWRSLPPFARTKSEEDAVKFLKG